MDAAIGLDVGGTKILACAVNEVGEILSEARVPSPQDANELVEALENAIVGTLDGLSLTSPPISRVGLGLPGLVDMKGVLHETPNLPAAQGLNVRRDLEPRLAALFAHLRPDDGPVRSVTVDNDATCAAAGERAFGAARSIGDAVVVTLGTGIGGGLVVEGRLVRGAHGFGGEIGHMVIDLNGPLCKCGRHGCWELFASGPGLARIAESTIDLGGAQRVREIAAGQAVRAEDVFQAAGENDRDAVEIVGRFAEYLAQGLGNLAEVLDPEAIILGGGMARSADLFMPRTRAAFSSSRRGAGDFRVELLVAQRGEYAGAIGAAAIALGIVS